MAEEKRKRPSLLQALIPIIFLVTFLSINVIFVFKEDALFGPNQIGLILSAAVAGLVCMNLGVSWQHMEKSIVRSITAAMPSMLILLLIGALAGTWMLSGIVPAMIYYGLQILNPTIFLIATCVVCAIVSIATGSSWSTVATVGIALLGIGKALEISEGLIAGAIISGAYFGDKMSPLSDTTNLAPAMAGTDLFTHIRYMAFTTVPSLVIALCIYLVIGLNFDAVAGTQNIDNVLRSIEQVFTINPLLFIVPVAVIVMIIKKVPAVPALLIGSLLGGLFAVIFQGDVIRQVVEGDNSFLYESFVAVMNSLITDVAIAADHQMVDELLVTGGMAGMLNTIWLIITAMVFGGMMEAGGLLQRITQSIIHLAKSTGSLVASTASTCIFFNATASDQYLAIVVPGRMYAHTYKTRGLKPENLSRTLEDSGTVTSVLIPWNTCGATQSSVLGVSTFIYAPFCFFNIISPFMTVLFAYLNIKIARYKVAPKIEKEEEYV